MSLFQCKRAALLVTVLAGIACALGLIYHPARVYPAYLSAWFFFLSISLGCMTWAMIQNLMQAGWGRAIQRICEAAAMNLPLLGLLLVPVLLGLKHLYPWARPEMVQEFTVLQHRAAYLNPGAFTIRAVVYFAVWSYMAFAMARNSAAYDRTQSPVAARRLSVVSAPGIAIYVLTITLAAVDWLMSREVQWYSTIFGFLIAAGQSLGGMAFAVVVLTLLVSREPLKNHVTTEIFIDLGNLLLMGVILWMYMEFMQYLVLWMGNVQEDIRWHTQRMNHGWLYISIALFLLGFLVPFFLLLMRDIKGSPRRLMLVALLILAMRAVWCWWLVAPSGENPMPSLDLHWSYPVCYLTVGGIWSWAFLGRLARMPLLPVPVRRDEEIAQHGTGELSKSA